MTIAALLLAAVVASDPAPPLARRPAPSISVPPIASPPIAPPQRTAAARVVGRADDPPSDAPDRWLGVDKVKHFFLAGFVESVAYALARSAGASADGALATGVGFGAAVSIGKEVRDRRSGRTFSVRDLVWDAAGLLAHGALLAQTAR